MDKKQLMILDNITEKLINDLFTLGHKDLSDAVAHQAKRCLLDYLGVTFAGARMLKEKGEKLLIFLRDSQPDASVIGFHRKAGIQNAAFINGLSGHIAELDDGVNAGIVHPGSPILSALLPLAQREKITGKDLISGIVTGYEAAVRLACAIQPSHKKRGYHATGTCGAIGAAIGCSSMLGFTKSEMKDAFSSAAISASGTLKVLEDGSELKPFNAGRAAVIGLLATSMAVAGFAGPDDVLSGSSGFLSVMSDSFDVACVERQNGGPLGIERIYVKPYAACRYCHPAIEAALRIKSTHHVCPEEIKTVKVSTYLLAVNNHDYTRINGVSSAKMSIPFSVAVALVTGKAGIDAFTPEYINDQAIISLTNKVSVRSDNHLTALFPMHSCAIVEIRTRNGNCFIESVDSPKGEPVNPLTDEEIQQKFISLSYYAGKSAEEAREIMQVIWNLEKSLHELYRYL